MMDLDPKLVSALAALVLLAILVLARRRLFDLTCTGVFFLSYLLFVGLGAIAAPWLIEGYLQESFSYIRWELITPRDLNLTTLIITSGLVAFLVGSYAADIFRGRTGARWLALLRAPSGPFRLGASPPMVFLTYLGFAAIAASLLVTLLPAILEGFLAAYIQRDHTAYYRVREVVQELGLVYYLIIYNALPFCAQVLFVSQAHSPHPVQRRTAVLWLVPPLLFLQLTFEKTPLVLFILISGLAWMLAQLYSGRLHLRLTERFSVSQLARVLFRLRRHLRLPLAAAIVILMVLYTLTTDSITNQTSPLAVAGKALLVVVDRICLRLAVMPLMYAHYFPQVEPFYGFSNVGKLTFLTGAEYYPDTQKVLHYFTGVEEGNGAIGSLSDFHAGFGWAGLVLGGVGLGVVLRVADQLLRSLPATALNRVLWIYLLYVSWYLSQASIFRCLSSYGGAIFLALWLVFSLERAWSVSGRRAPSPS